MPSDLSPLAPFRWPDTKPAAPTSSFHWGLDGTDLLRAAVAADATVIVEIGSLLGGSARFFAENWPEAHVYCVDPWFDVSDTADRPFLEHAPELARYVTEEVDGIYQVFLATNWDLRDRLTPVRGFSPDALAPLHAAGVDADIVYIDGSHVYEDVLADVTTAAALFPRAVLCGDDWNWPGVGEAVRYVATNRRATVRTAGNTWLLEGGDDTRRVGAPSARSTARARRSLPVRLVEALRRELRPGP